MYYDVSSSNTLQDKIKFVVLLFILYIVLQVSKGKGTVIIRRSISLFLKVLFTPICKEKRLPIKPSF